MIDSHCHLNFNAFISDWREVAKRAISSGVDAIINVGSNLDTSLRAVELSESMPHQLYAAIALHPIHVGDERFDIDDYEKLIRGACPAKLYAKWGHPDREQRVEGSLSDCHCERSAAISPVIALGETGIDLYHNPDNLEVQRDAFIQFIELANKHHLPVIIHNRNAGPEVLEILIKNRPRFGGVMHFFSEDWNYAQKLFDMNLLVSFTGAITLDNVDAKTIEVIKKAPLNKIMIETDAPYVVPEPLKAEGIKRNEPAHVVEVARRIAEIKGIDISEVASQTTKNTVNLFRLSSRP